MGARCSMCGGSVMSYPRYLLYSRPSAVCASCGETVRLHGWWGLVAGGIFLLAVLLGTVLLVESLAVFLGITVGLTVLALVLDYVGFRTLRWEPVSEARSGTPPTGAAPA